MDDGLGFSIGSLIGGFLYQKVGGSKSFQIFSGFALIACLAHVILRSSHQDQVQSEEAKAIETTLNEEKLEFINDDKKVFSVDDKSCELTKEDQRS